MKHLFTFCLSFMIVLSSCQNETIETHELTQEQELVLLKNQYEQIVLLSESKDCVNSNDWLFTPLGNKACGGPTGFIAYSTDIDTVNFLNLVKEYTSDQKAYNQKWGVISDCSVPPAPSAIKCENGFPIFVY